MTSAEPHTSHCKHHVPCRSHLQTSVVKVFPLYQRRDPYLSNLSSRAKLFCIKSPICCSSSPMRHTRIGSEVLYCGCGGGGGRVIVVVIVEVVAVGVGSRESNCIIVRSITGVVIGGIEEVS
ncbi:hypothetical protein Tco_0567822 [Tanacetum coccineum]